MSRAIVAVGRKQGRTIKRYISGLLRSVPVLAKLIDRETREAIHLTKGLVIEIHTSSYKTLRGCTIVCFIGDEGYKGFIEERTPVKFRPSGAIRSVQGLVMGSHEGLHRYTIGQKKGLTLKGMKENDEYFVVGYDSKDATLIVGPEEALFHRELVASKANWVAPVEQLKGIRCQAKIRSRAEEAACIVTCSSPEVMRLPAGLSRTR